MADEFLVGYGEESIEESACSGKKGESQGESRPSHCQLDQL